MAFGRCGNLNGACRVIRNGLNCAAETKLRLWGGRPNAGARGGGDVSMFGLVHEFENARPIRKPHALQHPQSRPAQPPLPPGRPVQQQP